ncbi:putative ribosomal protein L35 [Babesia bovis T2Bo]|uniref:50S ribosomal protein L35 n=1 Tax=Babesia bovis TaxID=5865 RepID=A7AQY0_BABBO|nr:putative ribosomal protein L35 [Babesia bovis T2Bo]EDO06949.1 putative ribosomal protein L35 [Babesia bovis T2Bo]|eukprot:XP_001610517.1 ribosomal protein L35 [Babesia bovis T2Bo]
MRSLFIFWTVSIFAYEDYRATSVAAIRVNDGSIIHTKQAFIGISTTFPVVYRLHIAPLFARRAHKLKLTAGGKFRIKPKTNKAVSKRFKITATGKLIYKRAGKSHLQRKKTHGAKRRLKRSVQLKNPRLIRKILSVLHNR